MEETLRKTGRTRRGALRSIPVALILAAASFAVQAQTAVFTAVLQPTQEVPPILSSTAFGNAFMTFDLATMELCYSITYGDVVSGQPDLASGETVAHFHGPAAPGVNAGITFNISPAPSPVGSPKEGCVGPLTSEQITELVQGLWYINVHSNDFPGGEIRGQVLFERVIR